MTTFKDFPTAFLEYITVNYGTTKESIDWVKGKNTNVDALSKKAFTD